MKHQMNLAVFATITTSWFMGRTDMNTINGLLKSWSALSELELNSTKKNAYFVSLLSSSWNWSLTRMKSRPIQLSSSQSRFCCLLQTLPEYVMWCAWLIMSNVSSRYDTPTIAPQQNQRMDLGPFSRGSLSTAKVVTELRGVHGKVQSWLSNDGVWRRRSQRTKSCFATRSTVRGLKTSSVRLNTIDFKWRKVQADRKGIACLRMDSPSIWPISQRNTHPYQDTIGKKELEMLHPRMQRMGIKLMRY